MFKSIFSESSKPTFMKKKMNLPIQLSHNDIYILGLNCLGSFNLFMHIGHSKRWTEATHGELA